MVVGIAVLATNLVAAGWGVIGWLRKDARASIALVSEGMRVGIAQREIEGVEDIEALERSEQVALAKRVALGEMGVMTVGALLILTLALRAFQTGG